MENCPTSEVCYWTAILIPLVAALIGAVVGGVFAVIASMKSTRHILQSLEGQELRKLRVKCIYELLSYRYILSNPAVRDWAEKQPFNVALNAATGLWSDHQDALQKIRVLRGGASNLALYELVKCLASSVGLDFRHLDADDFENIMSV